MVEASKIHFPNEKDVVKELKCKEKIPPVFLTLKKCPNSQQILL